MATAGVSVHGRIGGTIGGERQSGLGVNLHIERTDLDVRYDDDSGGDRLEVGRIGLAFSESVAPGIRLGASIGAQRIDQTGRSTTAGLDPDGYYATFDARGRWGLSQRVNLELGGRLAYAEASDSVEDGKVELDWWSATLRPAVAVTLAERLELRAGVRAQWLDGHERVTGPTTATVGFQEDAVTGGFVGAGLLTGNGGRIHLRADTGPARGVRLVFERLY